MKEDLQTQIQTEDNTYERVERGLSNNGSRMTYQIENNQKDITQVATITVGLVGLT